MLARALLWGCVLVAGGWNGAGAEEAMRLVLRGPDGEPASKAVVYRLTTDGLVGADLVREPDAAIVTRVRRVPVHDAAVSTVVGRRRLLVATAPGCAIEVLTRAPDSETITFRRSPALAGRLRDADGRPVAGAEVFYQYLGVGSFQSLPLDRRPIACPPLRTTSDDEGRFRLPRLRIDGTSPRHRLVAIATRDGDTIAGHLDAPGVRPPGREGAEAAGTEALRGVLKPLRRIRGRVLAAGEACADCPVRTRIGGILRETRTDETGRFAFDGLFEPHGDLVIDPPDLGILSLLVRRAEGADPAVDAEGLFRVPSVRRVRIRCVDPQGHALGVTSLAFRQDEIPFRPAGEGFEQAVVFGTDARSYHAITYSGATVLPHEVTVRIPPGRSHCRAVRAIRGDTAFTGHRRDLGDPDAVDGEAFVLRLDLRDSR